MNSFKLLILTLFILFALNLIPNVQGQTKQNPNSVAGGVVNGKALSLPKPELPADGSKSGINGIIKVQVIIDESGNIISAKTISGLEDILLRKAAENAAMKAKFLPTTLSENPVKVSGIIVYDFNNNLSNEEKVKIFGLATFLYSLRNSVTDIERFNKFFESEDIIPETIEEFSDFSAELTPLASLKKITPESRLAKVDEVISSVKNKLNNSDLWQFELGKNFSEIVYQFMVIEDDENYDISKYDNNQLKQPLLKIKDLCLSAPENFPKDVLDRLAEFAEFGNKDQILSFENFQPFFKKLEILLETISPNSTK